jgi:dethiobiotin synthetase
VGKTLVACTLVRALRRRGLDVGVMKPIETGVDAAGPPDALALREAAGCADPLERICPQRFALPAAPTVAAAAEQRGVDLDAVRKAFAELRAAHAWLVVEGAGGLLVPAGDGARMSDLARSFDLPLLVVARAALGTINHTRLTLEAAAARSLALAGVVISHADGPLSAADAANLDALRHELGPRLVGEIPPLAPGQRPAEESLDLDALFKKRGRS